MNLTIDLKANIVSKATMHSLNLMLVKARSECKNSDILLNPKLEMSIIKFRNPNQKLLVLLIFKIPHLVTYPVV